MTRQLLTTILLLAFITSFAQSLREIYQEGLQAYEQKDYVLFKEKMQAIDSLRPNYPPVVYNLAGAASLLKDSTSALKYLSQYVQMNALQSFEEEADFDWIRKQDTYKEIDELRKSYSEMVVFRRAFQLDLQEYHLESIAYDKKSKRYYLGAVRDGSIWKLEEDGTVSRWNQPAPDAWSVMGLEISKDGKLLWACTSAMENYTALQEGDLGKVSILKYDLKNGKLLETYSLPPNHVFGDLIVDSAGNVFISDGTQNKLYWISKEKGELESYLDLTDQAFNLQGLTYSKDHGALFISDYIDGIYRIKNKEILKVADSNHVIKGIDGLYYYRNKLIGLHNGTTPNRIVCYHLNEDGSAVVNAETIAQGGVLGEPTQGIIRGNKLLFIANSPWASYQKDGNFNINEDSRLIIGEITLKK